MAKYKRMINCDFVNASSFKLKISNRAKLLYFFMLTSADDKGFVDNADELIELLDSNDRKFDNESNMALLPNTFETAIAELLEKSLLYRFKDKHNNHIYLIKHWYLHNVIPKDRVRDSSYEKYLENMFVNDDGEYQKKQMPHTCDTTDTQLSTQIKEKKRKINKSNIIDMKDCKETSSTDDEEEDFDYSDIPERWDLKHSSMAIKLYVLKTNGKELTKEQQNYLEAYQQASKTDTKESDTLPFLGD